MISDILSDAEHKIRDWDYHNEPEIMAALVVMGAARKFLDCRGYCVPLPKDIATSDPELYAWFSQMDGLVDVLGCSLKNLDVSRLQQIMGAMSDHLAKRPRKNNV